MARRLLARLGKGGHFCKSTLSERGWLWASANTGLNKSPTGQRQNRTCRAAASGTSQVYQASLWKGTSVALRRPDAARPPRPSSHLCAFRTESRSPLQGFPFICLRTTPPHSSLFTNSQRNETKCRGHGNETEDQVRG